MSASRERKTRKTTETAPVQAKKSMKNLLIGILVAAIVIGSIGSIILFKGPLFRRHSAAVTVGEYTLSPVTVRYFYADYFNSFCNNYGSLMSYIFTSTDNIDQQIYDEETQKTWGDFFMEGTLSQIKNTYALYDAAQKAGFTLDEEGEQSLTELQSLIETYASPYSVSSDLYISNIYGQGSNMKTFMDYQRVLSTATAYQEKTENDFTFSADDIAAEYAANPADYDTFTYYAYLVTPETAEDADEAATEAAQAEARKQAEEIAEKSGSNLDTYFEMVSSVSGQDDPEALTLRDNYRKASIPSDLTEWITDSSRKEGDTTAITVDAGTYVVYYSGRFDNNYSTVNAHAILLTAEADESGVVDLADAQDALNAVKAAFDAEEHNTEFWTNMVTDYSNDSNNSSEEGLYTNINKSTFDDEAMNEWLFDASRKSGDNASFETPDGIYFICFEEQSTGYRDLLVENALRSEAFNNWYSEVTNIADPVTGSFGMGYVDRTLNYNAQS